MKYFTTDTHFGHPLVSVLRGFTTFDPGHTQYDALLSSQGRKAAEDWVKGVVLDDSRLNFRKAADTDAHDEAIVANINRIVGEDDELWILGDIGYRTSVRHLNVYGQINVYGVTTKSERHKRSYWTRTADGNGIGGRKAPVPYGS